MKGKPGDPGSRAAEAEALAEALMLEVLDSFEKLEIVVRLPPPGTTIAATALQAATMLASSPFDEELAALIADGVVERIADQLAIAGGRWARHCAAVAALHRDDRFHLVTMMSRASLARLRTKTARAFADAFVIRSNKGEHRG